MIERLLYKTIDNKLFVGKVIILTGARQVGKTTLLKQLLRQKEGVLWLNGDELQVQNLFANASADRLLSEFSNSKIVILDEAQRIENIGLRLKLIADSDSEVQVIATGSSAFELANKDVPVVIWRDGGASRKTERDADASKAYHLWILPRGGDKRRQRGGDTQTADRCLSV